MKRDTYAKIKSLNELEKITRGLRGKGRTIVQCHGVFDLLHPGHIKHFESAKKKGDVLVVTLTRDEYVNKGPGRPVFNQQLRAESVAAIECVDFVAVNEWPTAVETIRKLRPHFYAKGKDYAVKGNDVTGKINDEEQAVRSVGGSVIYTDDVTFSSSTLINTFFAPYSGEAKDFLLKFRKKYPFEKVRSALTGLSGVKILVIGDIIIDEYSYCAGVGKSQKENLIAARFLNEEIFAGGVLATANHLAGFCRDVTLLSCVGGKNHYDAFIKSRLKRNIRQKLFYCDDALTVVKRRYVDPNFLSKLFELCYFEDANYLPARLENRIAAYLDAHLEDFDMVLVADFGHGLITRKIVDLLCKKAKFLAVNTQTNSSNIGFNLITKFPRADYICIDEPEMRLACHDRFSKLETLILGIGKRLSCDRIIVTRGHKGCLVYSKKEGFHAIPVFSKEIVDRIGAGDAYFSVTAPCVYRRTPIEMVGFIGNLVGAMKVLIVGNRSSVEPVPLMKYMTSLLK